ncbi:MAG: phenylalanine--tRNA ligase subunit beta [Candidatus Uhrbacteria bacterium]|nr:phenylalanine--tRNA ligase subunit beta [Candidatus Uhrbacteria bacterium]
MNILASYDWIKEYLTTDLAAADFAREFSLRSMSVERVESLADRFANMVVGDVVEVRPHPNADRLRIATTNIGEKTVDIVCGGANIAQGMKVLVALPGAWVRWHGGGDLIQLAITSIRGVESIGMICSPAEVGFEKMPCGEKDIWDLGGITEAAAGTLAVEALGLSDTLLDIEITTNRADCMSIVGLAREGGAITKAPFAFTPPTIPHQGTHAPITVEIVDKKRCARYMAAVVKNVKVAPSPWWLQKKLLLAGHRPINNIVDITNLVLHEYGQPLHAFDASKVEGERIVVRAAKKGEKLETLDGKTVELKPEHLVIADTEKPLSVAGVMGGMSSGTTKATTTVVFEAASFDAVSIRRTSRDLDLYSDSQLLFEKGLSTEALPQALARAIELAQEIAGGELAGDVVDARAEDYEPRVYSFRPQKVRDRIGVDIADGDMVTMLEHLGFDVKKVRNGFSVTVPFWRDHDIEDEVDFTEEVARLYGYHLMPAVLPTAPPPAESDDVSLHFEMWTKRFLASVGFAEFFSSSMVDAADLERYGFSPMDAMKIHNPLSIDASHLRPSLIPSVLRSIERNQANAPSANIFELARVYIPREGDLPDERFSLVIGRYGVHDAAAAYMALRGVLEAFARKTGITLSFEREDDAERWHHGRTAAIMFGGERIGTIGQVEGAFQDAFGIHRPVFLAEVDLERLIPHLRHAYRYEPVPEFPVVARDISVLLGDRVEFVELADVVRGASGLVRSVDVVEIYRGAEIESGKKSVTFSVTIAAADRTLTSEEVEEALGTITRELILKFDGVIRG